MLTNFDHFRLLQKDAVLNLAILLIAYVWHRVEQFKKNVIRQEPDGKGEERCGKGAEDKDWSSGLLEQEGTNYSITYTKDVVLNLVWNSVGTTFLKNNFIGTSDRYWIVILKEGGKDTPQGSRRQDLNSKPPRWTLYHLFTGRLS